MDISWLMGCFKVQARWNSEAYISIPIEMRLETHLQLASGVHTRHGIFWGVRLCDVKPVFRRPPYLRGWKHCAVRLIVSTPWLKLCCSYSIVAETSIFVILLFLPSELNTPAAHCAVHRTTVYVFAFISLPIYIKYIVLETHEQIIHFLAVSVI